MSAATYAELLHRPEWQRVRLKAMERDGFTCCECYSADRTLNVHHCYYTKGARPWEYPLESLVTLCEGCHAKRNESDQPLRTFMGGVCRYDRASLLGTAAGMWMLREQNTAPVRVPGDEVEATCFYIALAREWQYPRHFSDLSMYAFAHDCEEGEWIDREAMLAAMRDEVGTQIARALTEGA